MKGIIVARADWEQPWNDTAYLGYIYFLGYIRNRIASE